MKILNLTSGLEKAPEVVEKDYSASDIYTGYMNQNIIGYKRFHDETLGQDFKKESFTPQEAEQVLIENNVPTDSIEGMIADSVSLKELEAKAKFLNSNNKEIDMINSHGLPGMAASLGVSIIDLPGWVIGLGVGKVAQAGITGAKLAGRSAKVAQAASGATGAVASVGALEATLGNDLTSGQISGNAALGFILGYATAGTTVHSPDNQKKIDETISGENPIQGFYQKEDNLIPLLTSPSDQMKTSDNIKTREAGSKLTPSMSSAGLQDQWTVSDIKSITKGYLTEAGEEFEDYSKAFKEGTGKDLELEDQKAINKLGLDIDNGYTKEKDRVVKELNESNKIVNDNEISTKTKEIEDNFIASEVPEYSVKTQEIQSKLDSDMSDIDKKYSVIAQENTTKEKIKIYKDTEKIKKRRKKQYVQTRSELVSENKKRIKESADSIKSGGKVALLEKRIRAKYAGILKDLEPKKGIRRKSGVVKAYNKAKKEMSAEIKSSKSELINKKKNQLEASFDQDLKNRFDKINKTEDNKYKSLKGRIVTPKNNDIQIELAKKQLKTQAQKEVNKLKSKIRKNKKLIKELSDEKKKIKLRQKQETYDAAILKSQKRLEDLVEGIDPKYKKGVEIIRNFKQKYGQLLKENDVDGLSNLDNSFHWSKQYDADRIAQDPAGAVNAFKRGLSDNFKEIDDDLAGAIHTQAVKIVDNIMASNASVENIDIDKKLIDRLTGETNKKTLSRGSNLKGRKLKINGAELVDFMSNDIMANLTGYNNSVGGRIAVKKILGIDKSFSANDFTDLNGFTGKDKHNFDVAVQQAMGTHSIDPRANSLLSKMVRGFNAVNFLNFGGWFGANTLTDISIAANDFGLSRVLKYSTQDISQALKGNPKGKSLGRYLGLSAEGMTNDRARAYGGDSIMTSRQHTFESALHKGGSLMSKLNGMNMATDFMDRVTSMASLDYILTGSGTKFIKNMNRMGISSDTINKLKANKGFITWADGSIKDVDLTKLDTKLRADTERGLRRAVHDVVLKGEDLDNPEFLTEIFGSHALAKALFQFMRFPTIAYNKVGRKMYNNFDAVDAIVSMSTASMMLGLITQMKDVGKAEARYDLSTDKGQANTASFILERMPALAALGLVQTQVDLIGRMLARGMDEDYKAYSSGTNLGITWDRLQSLQSTGQRIIDGTANERDIMTFKSFLSTNLIWLQPINNMVNDSIMDR